MAAKTVSKADLIEEELILALEQNKELSEFEFRKFQRDANSITDYVSRNHALGILYTIVKNDSLMYMYFDRALSLGVNIVVLYNYFSCLNRRSCFSKSKEVFYKYKDYINTNRLVLKAFNVASFYLDNDIATFLYDKALLIKCDEELVESLFERKKKISQIREMTKCSDEHVESLVNIYSRIIRKYNQKVKSFYLETIAGGHYVIAIDTDNLDTIVDMNFELADEIVANAELDSCKLVAVFEPYTRINK
ncbi:hypothetical protein A9G15_03910 [Gilliamella apis]|uniref:hypothetical protein n=1 Tax=Gilliamella apis TaxID=1970738 RepID=UPI00080E5B0F|nr:hypothetical protein [Gilliamella apis]OCG04254.1 hypothetical protein A9G15_03910 [Gilliamella apis]